MTTRERWIVYPLLFLSLGLALRDKLIPSSVRAVDLMTPKIRCNELEVANVRCLGKIECGALGVSGPKGKDLVRMGRASNGAGRVELCGVEGKTVVVLGAGGEGKSGVVETLSSDGAPLVQLRSTKGGGTVWTIDRQKKAVIMLGHNERDSGLFMEVPGRRIPLAVPVRRKEKAPEEPPEKKTPKAEESK